MITVRQTVQYNGGQERSCLGHSVHCKAPVHCATGRILQYLIVLCFHHFTACMVRAVLIHNSVFFSQKLSDVGIVGIRMAEYIELYLPPATPIILIIDIILLKLPLTVMLSYLESHYSCIKPV